MFTLIMYSRLHWSAKAALSALLCAGIVYAAFEFIYPAIQSIFLLTERLFRSAIGKLLKERHSRNVLL